MFGKDFFDEFVKAKKLKKEDSEVLKHIKENETVLQALAALAPVIKALLNECSKSLPEDKKDVFRNSYAMFLLNTMGID